MWEHRLEITDSRGRSAKFLVRMPDLGWGTWQALDFGYFRYVNGVAKTAYEPTAQFGWLALYGGDEPVDEKLVLHLDDFLDVVAANPKGTGVVYKQDYICMEPGKVTWKLLA